MWRIHRKIGMSGGLFTNMLLRETGLAIDAERVDRLRARHADAYRRLSADVRPLPGARELLAFLADADIPWAIATSGRMETAGPVLETLGVDPGNAVVITRDQVKYAKPDPDLFLAAAERLGVPKPVVCARFRARASCSTGSPRRACPGPLPPAAACRRRHTTWRRSASTRPRCR